MRPLQPHNNTSDKNQVFEQAAESWLQRMRNPHADTAFLDAVQRRQEPRKEALPTASPGVTGEPSASLAPVSRPTVCLIKLQGQQKSHTWLLPHDRPVIIGRSRKSTLPLDINLWPDIGVSRRHAVIWFDGESWYIEDLCSTNGTALGQNKIRGQRAIRLEPGVRMQIGSTTLMLLALSHEGEQPPAATPPSSTPALLPEVHTAPSPGAPDVQYESRVSG